MCTVLPENAHKTQISNFLPENAQVKGRVLMHPAADGRINQISETPEYFVYFGVSDMQS